MDRYTKVKPLGKGSFGAALLIKRKTDGELFVVKEVNLAKMSAKEKDEARNEVRVLQKLSHPNIVKYVEHFEKSGVLYIVMEYADGGDLHKKIQSQKLTRMKEEVVLHYFAQLCLAMEYLHSRHILHRDIKTMNIFLTSNGTVKLGDFGISTVLRNTMGMANTVCGTPYYFSPELCRNKPYNNRSDVWALGVVLYELAMLRHPFDGNSMNQLMQRIIRSSYSPIPSSYSKQMRELLAMCLQKDPAKRPNIRQLLILDCMKTSLERLQQNLMMATVARVRLQNIVTEEEANQEKVREMAAERERMKKENAAKHAELQKKLGQMPRGAVAGRRVSAAPKPAVPRRVVQPAPGERKPGLPVAAVGRRKDPVSKSPMISPRGYPVAGAKPKPQPQQKPQQVQHQLQLPFNGVPGADPMKPIEDFIAHLDQPVEKRVADQVAKLKAERVAEDKRKREAEEAKKREEEAKRKKDEEIRQKALAQQRQLQLDRVMAEKKEKMEANEKAKKAAAVNVDPRAAKKGAAGGVRRKTDAAVDVRVGKVNENLMPKPNRLPDLQPIRDEKRKAGSDPAKVAKAQNWADKQNDEKKRQIQRRLDEERKAVAQMDDQVSKGMQARVVDPALEAWVQREMGKGRGGDALTGQAAAQKPKQPNSRKPSLAHLEPPPQRQQPFSQPTSGRVTPDQQDLPPPVVSRTPPPNDDRAPRPGRGVNREDLPAAVSHRRAMGLDAVNANPNEDPDVRRSIDAVDKVFREHGMGKRAVTDPEEAPLPAVRSTLATPEAVRHKRSMSDSVAEEIDHDAFMQMPLLQRSPLHLKNKGRGEPVRLPEEPRTSRDSYRRRNPDSLLEVANPPRRGSAPPERDVSAERKTDADGNLWKRRQTKESPEELIMEDLTERRHFDQGRRRDSKQHRDRSAPPALGTPKERESGDFSRVAAPEHPVWISPETSIAEDSFANEGDAKARHVVASSAPTAAAAVPDAPGEPVDVHARNKEYQNMMSHIHNLLAPSTPHAGAGANAAGEPDVDEVVNDSIVEDIIDTTEDDFGDAEPMTPGHAMNGGAEDADEEVEEEVLFRLAHLCGEHFAGKQPCLASGEPLFGSQRPEGQDRNEKLRFYLETLVGEEVVNEAYVALQAIGGRDEEDDQAALDSAKEQISAVLASEYGGGDEDDENFLQRSRGMHPSELDDEAVEERADEIMGLVCQLIYFEEGLDANMKL